MQLKEKLTEAAQIIKNQNIEIQKLKENLNIRNNNFRNIQNEITNKNNQITILKQQLQNSMLINNKNEQIYKNDIRCVTFITTDHSLFYGISCSGNDTFAEVEEKLYKEYPEFRETNNTFLANGSEILRFKTINDNKIGTGKPIILVRPS